MTRATPAPRIELSVEREAGAPAPRAIVLDTDVLRIGSHASNELVVHDPEVSRFHCQLAREKGAWRITDTGSLNGTRVSGVSVRDADLAMPECRIEIGDSVIRARELVSTTEVSLLDQPNLGPLFGKSVVMRKLFGMIQRVAASDANVLIEGESGTGKELVASELVKRGGRAREPFGVVDCSAISANLIESTLFGHARGAFTGADRERMGAFEAASGGTVFLDEIGEMPLEMQPKLLRVLEAREVTRLGENRPRPVDVRVIAATNRRLEREVNHGRFREDLYFRLSVVTLRVPPLRARTEDLEVLVPALLESMNAQRSAHLFSKEVLAEMARHDWPGNVRELRNYVERAVVLQTVEPNDPAAESVDGASLASPERAPIDLEVPLRVAKERVTSDFEKRYVTAVLEWAQGNVSRAARKAGTDRMNLHRLIQRYALRPPRPFKD